MWESVLMVSLAGMPMLIMAEGASDVKQKQFIDIAIYTSCC
jgi:hypothetical protein